MDFRALKSETQEAIRTKAVDAVINGKKQIEVAEIFGVSREAVCKWTNSYLRKGRKSLKAGKRGRPKGGKLLSWQAAQIARTVIDKTPEQLKFPFYLWTREAVGALIEKRFGIILSVWTLGRYLRKWGFTPQKPMRRAYEQNPAAIKKWLEDDYPEIRENAKKENAEIYWGDEMGLRSDYAVGRSYGKKGNTPVIKGTGQRFRCNMISAITNRGALLFMVFKDSFVVGTFIKFMKKLLEHNRRRVYLIVDNHPVHRSKTVREWLDENKERIKIFYLPGYAPELNPDEELNNDVKSNAVGRKRAKNQEELLNNTKSHLRSRRRRPDIIRNFFKEKHVRYAAA